jgi:hypothetical protein
MKSSRASAGEYSSLLQEEERRSYSHQQQHQPKISKYSTRSCKRISTYLSTFDKFSAFIFIFRCSKLLGTVIAAYATIFLGRVHNDSFAFAGWSMSVEVFYVL